MPPALAASLGGCHHRAKIVDLQNESLYEQGQKMLDKRHFLESIKVLGDVGMNALVSDDLDPLVKLALADAYFLTEDYGPAAETYKEFESVHPRSEEIPYVLYQIGVSNFKRSESIDMPQGNLQEALQYFYLLQQTFPDTDYGKEAVEYIRRCRKRLAEHELFVADFYWRTDQYGAAWKRYMYTADNFKDLEEVLAYSRLRAQLSYLEYQKTLSEAERRKIEGSWHNWLKRWL